MNLLNFFSLLELRETERDVVFDGGKCLMTRDKMITASASASAPLFAPLFVSFPVILIFSHVPSLQFISTFFFLRFYSFVLFFTMMRCGVGLYILRQR